MNSFGLGLILSFVDNASAGMNTATANFNRMSATADSLTSSVSASATEMASIAFSLGAVGDTFTAIGESIMGVFTGITQRVISTGGEMLNYRMQLTALYGSVGAGEAKMEEIKKYAMSSVFEIQSLIPAVTMMKTVGIEALDSITTSSGNATQKLLDYASDLAAMQPYMHNVYGTGVQAAMGAFKEYIAEGNALSLKRGAGLDITGILGEDKGATIAERTQQVADLIEKLGIVGYTANLAGTPTQRLSNMQDALFNSLSKIADSGVFEAYCVLLETLSDWVFNLVENEETFNAITGVLSETITAFLSPLQSMLDWVVQNSDAIINWVKENPKLVKNILLTVAAVGALLIVGGSLLKLLSSIAFAMSGLNVLKSIPLLFAKMGAAVLPFIALAGIAYTAWDKNLGGIRDKITWFMNNIGDIFTVLSDAWGDNTLSEDNFIKAKQLGILPFIEGILQLKYYWDFFVQGFKTGFTSFFEGLVNSLGVLGVDIADLGNRLLDFLERLTQPGAEEEWVKLGEAMGALVAVMATLALVVKIITPIIKAVITLGKAVLWVVSVFKNLWTAIKWGSTIITSIIKFIGDLGAAIALMKEGFGFFQVMAVWFPKLAPIFAKLGAVVAKLAPIFLKVGTVFTKLGGWIVAGVKAIGAAIVSAVTALAAYLGLPVWAVVAIIAAIVVVITLLIVFRKQVAQFFVWLWGKITEFSSWLFNAVGTLFSNLWSKISPWLGSIFAKVQEIISNIVQAILNNPIVQSVIGLFTSIYNVIAGIVMTIVEFIVGRSKVIWSVIKLVGTFIAGVAKVIWAVISGIIKVIWTNIQGLANFIATIAVGIWNVIKGVANVIVAFVKAAITVITGVIEVLYQFFRVIFYAILAVGKIVITAIADLFKWLWSLIQPILRAIGDFFKFIFDWVKINVIDPFVSGVVFVFNFLRDTITTVITTVANFFALCFNWVNDNVITPFRDFIGGVFDWISNKVDEVTSWIAFVFTSCANTIKGVFSTVSDFFSGVWEGITDGATAFFDWVTEKLSAVVDAIKGIGDFLGNTASGAGDYLGSIGDKLKSFVGLDTGGYVKTTGLAVLHPNEVVVNDDTTKRLQNFLGNYESATPTASIPAKTSESSGKPSYVPFTAQSTIQEVPVTTTEKVGETHNDYSVTFAAGSVVIQLLNASDSELEKAAEKIMKIIARKQQLRAMAVRT